jgi:hypothetical protein
MGRVGMRRAQTRREARRKPRAEPGSEAARGSRPARRLFIRGRSTEPCDPIYVRRANPGADLPGAGAVQGSHHRGRIARGPQTSSAERARRATMPPPRGGRRFFNPLPARIHTEIGSMRTSFPNLSLGIWRRETRASFWSPIGRRRPSRGRPRGTRNTGRRQSYIPHARSEPR